MARTDTYSGHLVVAILSILFGMGTWITVNGIWVELPLLVDKLPEGWNLASYLVIIIQLANIGPIVYSVSRRMVQHRHVLEHFTIHCILAIGAAASVMLAVSWSNVSYIAGSERSLPLFVLVFFLALMVCTSSVVFLPFMSNFKEKYLTYFLIGSGLSGFVPSIVALIQGVGGNPECRNITMPNATETMLGTSNATQTHKLIPVYPPPQFPVRDFFYFIFSTMIASWVAFLLMNKLPIALKEQIRNAKDPREQPTVTDTVNAESTAGYDEIPTAEGSGDSAFAGECNAELTVDGFTENKVRKYFDGDLTHLLLLQCWACILSHGVFPAIQPFSCLPYGNQAYHFAVTLANMANPVACFVAMLVPLKSTVRLILISVYASIVASYIMATALLSPSPPLQDSWIGIVLVVTSWIVMFGIFSYVKANVAAILHTRGKHALFLCGAVTQVGSAIGALVIFVLINFTNLFQSYYPCS